MKKRETPYSDLSKLPQAVRDEPVFMSIPKKIGHDQRGAFIPLRDALGDVVVREVKKKRFLRSSDNAWKEETFEESITVADDDLPNVLSDLKEWLVENRSAL